MKKNEILVGASILSEDFFEIKNTLKKINSSDLDFIHLDIMDGVFVPNISFGPAFVKDLRLHTDKFFDVHLMIQNPFNYIKQFVSAGADSISVHIEAKNVKKSLSLIKSLNKKCGIVINPKTSFKKLKKFLPYVDKIMVMTVEPGFGGQKFMQNQLKKISMISDLIKQSKRKILLEVDGGINFDTARLSIENGANVLVVGSFLFKQPKIQTSVLKFKNL